MAKNISLEKILLGIFFKLAITYEGLSPEQFVSLFVHMQQIVIMQCVRNLHSNHGNDTFSEGHKGTRVRAQERKYINCK
jgi:hypothetical protein